MKSPILNRVSPNDVALEIKDPVDPKALEQAKAILNELEGKTGKNGAIFDSSLVTVAKRLGDLTANDDTSSILISKQACLDAYNNLTPTERTTLHNLHSRIHAFAVMQRASIQNNAEIPIPGGAAGQTVSACTAAGCYAPGGRYPLPSSVLMTAATARAAGCPTVIVASPKPAAITMAAAHVAGADYMLGIGGAQAIAAMANGVVVDDTEQKVLIPRCDVICGPGNQWVTAAKSIVQGRVGIDMLAGPSEVLVICDHTAKAEIVAADLIAQAEHDVVARAIVLSTCPDMIEQVDACVAQQIACLPEPNKSTALEALRQSFAVQCKSIDECIEISDAIAPEHLEIQTVNAEAVGKKCNHYGGLFIGEHAAEVLGDYGAGPNHTLPTGGTGRYTGGLSVFNFLRIRTWMRVDDPTKSQGMVDDSITMARLEGLEGHARAAETRSATQTPKFKSARTT